MFDLINPATGQPLRTLPAHTPAEVERLLAGAARAQATFAQRPVAERAALLTRVAALLRAQAPALGRLMAEEMGKPLAQGIAEAQKCAWVCEHYAQHGPALLQFTPTPTEARRSGVRLDPLGLILAIMPWNFPFWQLFRFAAPALVAGNGVLLKHAPNTLGCGDAIAALLLEAGAEPGLLTALRVDLDTTAALIADDRVAGVTLTGSTRAGRAVAALAGQHLKKCVLELGGSDPFIVLPDADLERAARVGAAARLLNSGQSCIAAKRFLVHQDVAAPFTAAFAAELARAVVGDPLDPATTVGPQAREDLRQALHAQVAQSVAAGAHLLLGGQPQPGPGSYYPPTLLSGCAEGMAAWDEETFGPVAALRTFTTVDEAVALANHRLYGLGASVWTQDEALAWALCGRLEVGSVFVNELVKSDPRLPFGGIRQSGYGRELGAEGVREWCNLKTVWMS